MKNSIIYLSLCLLISSLQVMLHGQNGFQDSRDGQYYTTIKVNGLVWMTRNLNYKTHSSIAVRGMGRLYNRYEAARVCPRGFRLPTDREWANLALTYGGYGNIGQQITWNGRNPRQAFHALYRGGKSGFNAVPSGEFSNNQLRQIGKLGHFWSSNLSNAAVFYRFIPLYNSIYRVKSTLPNDAAFACRCVRNVQKANPPRRPPSSPPSTRPKPVAGAVTAYMDNCRSCHTYNVYLEAPNFMRKGRRSRAGNQWKFTFPNIRPGQYKISVVAPVGSPPKGVPWEKWDPVRPKTPFRAQQIIVQSGQSKRVWFRRR